MKFVVAVLLLASQAIAIEFTVNYPEFTPLYAESNEKVREMMVSITDGFATRVENAFKSAAVKSEMFASFVDYSKYTVSQAVQEGHFQRSNGFDSMMKAAFNQAASMEYDELVNTGISQEEARKTAEKHLLARQKKFIEYILNAEYSMYEKIHEKLKTAVAELEVIEKFAYGDGEEPMAPTTSINEFLKAYNELLMDYGMIQMGSYSYPYLKIEDGKRLKCVTV